jgi:hypothetical protein
MHFGAFNTRNAPTYFFPFRWDDFPKDATKMGLNIKPPNMIEYPRQLSPKFQAHKIHQNDLNDSTTQTLDDSCKLSQVST